MNLELYKYYYVKKSNVVIMSLPCGFYNATTLERVVGLELQPKSKYQFKLQSQYLQEICPPKMWVGTNNIISVQSIKQGKFYFQEGIIIFKIYDEIYCISPELGVLHKIFYINNCYEIPFPTMPKR